MIILTVETYDSNLINPSLALDNYFGRNQNELKNWLKTLKYSSFIPLKDLKKDEYKIINDTFSIYSENLIIHLVLVGVIFHNDIENLNKIKNLIIYPFDKSNIIKNEFIKDILTNQLSFKS